MAITETQLFAFAHLDGGFVPAGRLTLTEEADQVLGEVWGGARQWRTVFEAAGAGGDLIDKVQTAFRKLEDIVSSDLVKAIRRAAVA